MKKVILVFCIAFVMAFYTGLAGAGKIVTVTEQYMEWLEKKGEAMPEMKKALKDKNFRMRTHAILGMAKTGDLSIVPLIIKALQEDDHVAVRNTAVYSLGLLKAKDAVPVLIKILPLKEGDKGYKRIKQSNIVEALGAIGDPAAASALYDALYTRSWSMQNKVQDAIIAVNGIYAAKKIIKEKDRIKEFGLQKSAAVILGDIQVEGAEQYVLDIARSTDGSELNAAITALGKMKSEKALPILYKGISSTGKRTKLLVKNSSNALVLIDSEASVEPLIEIVGQNVERPARYAAGVLSRMTSKSISEKVFILAKKDSRVNAHVAYILGIKQYKPSIPLFKERLTDQSQPGQDTMAEALGLMEDKGSIPLLMEVADRDNCKGSGGAVWALGNMKVKEAVPLLIKLLKEESEIINRVIAALGSMQDQRAVKPLINLFYETGQKHDFMIGSALINIGGKRVRQLIRDSIKSGAQPRVRFGGYMLSKMEDKELVPYAVSLLDHRDPKIVKFAIVCLRKNTNLEKGTAQGWKAWAKEEGIR